jgi:hypothetical protein
MIPKQTSVTEAGRVREFQVEVPLEIKLAGKLLGGVVF